MLTEAERKWHREWYAKNVDKVRKRHRKCYVKNAARVRAKQQAWRVANRTVESARQRAGRLKRRQIVLAKKNKPCIDCGQSFHFAAMDFDHVRGKKLFNLGTTACQSLAVLYKEIDKREVVCANCHRVRTWTRRHNEK